MLRPVAGETNPAHLNSFSGYRGRRALVFGAGGFIGRLVASALLDCGAEVVLVTRRPLSLRRVVGGRLTRGSVRVTDLSQAGEAARLLRDVAPDIVFNLAGYGVDREERDEYLSHRLNTALVSEITRTVEFREGWQGQCLIHVGSAQEFGTVDGDLSDPWVCAPTTPYGHTKLNGSIQLRDIADERRMRALCARLFTVYGPGEHQGRLLPTLLAGTHSTGPIKLSAGRQSRDFTYVADVVEGLLRLGLLNQEFRGRALNLATGELNTVREFVRRCVGVLGIDPGRLEFGAVATAADEMNHDPVSIEKMRALLAWTPTTAIEEGVRRTLAELKSA